MNIQIFGSKKDNDTKKAQRFFKERGIRFQYIDLRERTLIPIGGSRQWRTGRYD